MNLAACRAALREPMLVYAMVGLVLCGAILGPLYWPAAGGLDATGHPVGRDFINVWVGPQLAFGGRLATLFDLHGYAAAIGELFGAPLPFHNWSYPPFTLLMFWPLGQMPYFAALSLWTVLLFAAYAFVGLRFVPPERRWLALVLLAFAPASLMNIAGGQNGFMTAALFLGGLLAMERRPILAGVLFGLLTAKPQLGLVLPLVLLGLGAWRTIAAACVTTALLVGASILALGVEPWRQYLTVTSAFQLSLLQDFGGFYRYMMTSVLAGARTFGAPFEAAAIVQAIVSIGVLLVGAWAAVRARDVRQRALILAAAAPLVTPYAFNYDLTALTAALTWRLMGTDGDQPTGLKDAVFKLAWLAPMLLMLANSFNIGLGPLVLLAVFVLAVAEVAKDPQAPGGRSAEPAPA